MHTTLSRFCKLLLVTLATLPASLFAQQAYYAAAYPTAQQAQAGYPYGYATPAAARTVTHARPQAQPAVAMAVAPAAASNYLSFNGVYASAPAHMPAQVHYAVAAGNQLQGKPYSRGGGHRSFVDNAYDCSGSVSYALANAGLLNRPLSSKEFASYGEPGPGRFITIFVKPGEHVFMSICGLRLDTTGGGEGQGPRWRPSSRSTAGFIMRHPFGL